MTEASTPPEPELKSLRDRPFELLAQLERRGRAVSAQVSQEEAAGREWVGVALRMAGDLYLVAREETREVLGVPASTTRVPGARSWIKGLANVRGQLLPIIDLRHFLGSGVTPVTRNTRVVVVNHREIPAGLLVDEVLGFRRFAESEFSGDAPQAEYLIRSEEHTSELQSLTNLVCRLLLEKKKNNRKESATNRIKEPETSL